MRKLFIVLLIVAMFDVPAFAADDYQRSSGEQTGDALIYTGDAYLYQILVMPDGTNDVTVSVYDNTSASGTEVLPTMTFAGNGGAQATPVAKIRMTTGIYVDVTTTGTVAYSVLYRNR